MKTLQKLLFFLVVLGVAAGCTKQDEICDENGSGLQLKSADNRTIVLKFKAGEPGGFIWIPVICDGELVDYLYGDRSTFSDILRLKFEDGKVVRQISTARGYFQSQVTGHTYTFMEQDKINFDESGNMIYLRAVDNVKGDQGIHFLMICSVIDFETGELDFQKAMCVPNADNKDQ